MKRDVTRTCGRLGDTLRNLWWTFGLRILQGDRPAKNKKGNTAFSTVFKFAAVIFAALLVLSSLPALAQADVKTMDEASSPGNINNIAKVGTISTQSGTWVQADIDTALESDKGAFVYFYADWCPHCQQQKPVIDALEQAYRDDISFIRVDGGAYPDAVSQFGVTGFPCMLLITDQATKQFLGFTEEEILRENFEQAVNNASKSVVESNPLLTTSTEYESSPSTCSSSDPDAPDEFDSHMPEPFGDADSDSVTDDGNAAEAEATVQDRFIVGAGDSYASGEGNPYLSVADALEQALAAIKRLAKAAFSQAAKGATIWLGKTEYSVGEPVVMSGTGFTAAGTPQTITIVPSSAAQLSDLDFQGKTFNDAKASLETSDTHRIPLNIPGLQALPPLTFNFEYDDANRVIALDTGWNSPFPTGSPLHNVQVKLLILATWASDTDTAPEVALAIRVESQDLDKIIGGWTIPEVADPTALTSAVIVLSATGVQTITALNLANLTAARGLLTVDGVLEDLIIPQVATLRAKIDLAANQAFARVADFLGMDESSALILRGAIDNAATFLFDDEFDFDGDFALEGPIVIDSDELPDWLVHQVGHIPRFRLVFDGGTPQVYVEDDFIIQTGDVTNTFTYSISLDEAKDLDLRLAADTFNVPYGLDGLGEISQVELHITFAQASGVFTGEFDAKMSIGGAEQDLHITINDDPANTRAIVSIEGTIPVAGVVQWLSGATGLGSPSLTEVNFASATLGDIEFSYDHTDASGAVMGLHATITGIETFGASLHAEFLLGLDKPSSGSPTVLAALRVVDPACTPSPCIGLEKVFALPSASINLDLTLPAGNFLALYPEGSTFRTSRLGPEAKDFLDDVNGSPASEPFQISGGLNFIADIPTTGLNDMFTHLGLGSVGNPVHVQGSAGFNLTSLDTGTLNLNDFHVEATLPGSAPEPQDVPSWLTWPSTESWKFFLDYEENDVATDADDRLAVGLSIDGISSPLFPEVVGVFTARFSGMPAATPPAWVIEAKFEVGTWEDPFEIDWLSLQGAYALVRIEKDGDDIEASAEICGTIEMGDSAVVVGACASVDGIDPLTGTLTLQLVEPVSLGDILSLTGRLSPDDLNALGDLQALLDDIYSYAVGPGELTFTVTAAGFSFGGTLTATFAPFGRPLDVELVLYANFSNGDEPTITVGLKLGEDQTFGKLLLEQPLPVDIPFTPVNDLGVPDPSIGGFAFYFSKGDVNLGDPSLPDNIADWFRPLYGGDLEGRTLEVGGVGIGAIGSTRLPTPLAELVTTLGADPDLLMSATLGFDPFSIGLELTMSLNEDVLPDFIFGTELSLAASIDSSGIQPKLALTLGGTLDLRFKQGFELDKIYVDEGQTTTLADVLAEHGIHLPQAVGYETEDAAPACPLGGRLMQERLPYDEGLGLAPLGQWYCYDAIRIAVEAEVGFDGTSLSVSFYGEVSSLNGDPAGSQPWHPMGLEWLGIGEAGAEVEIGFDVTTQSVTFKVGFIGNMTLFGNPMAGALKVGALVSLAPPPAFVKAVSPLFDGFRFSLPNGIGKDQLDDLYAAFGQAPGVEELNLEPYLNAIPDIQFRNLHVSFSPSLEGVPSLCIAPLVEFTADVYLSGAPSAPVELPQCDGHGNFQWPPGGKLCAERGDGCFAGVDIELKPTGIIMEGSVGAFNITPLDMRFGNGIFALRLTLQDQYLRIHGGVAVGPPDDPTLAGHMSLGLGIGNVTFAGQAKAFGFNALVAGSMNINPLTLLTSTEDFGTLTLHVVLAAPQLALPEYQTGGFPDFSQEVRADLENSIGELAQIVDFITDTMADFAVDPLGTLDDLTEESLASGILPAWVGDILDGVDDAVQAIEAAGVDVSFTLEDVANGLKIFEGIEAGYRTCTGIIWEGVCYGIPVVPPDCPWPLSEVDGKCYAVPPITLANICPSLGIDSDGDGYCENEEFAAALESALDGLLEFSGLSPTALKNAVNGWFNPDPEFTVFSLNCASLDVDLSALGQSQFDMAFGATFLNNPLNLGFDWDFADFPGSAAKLLAALIQSGSGGQVCQGVDESLFDEGGLGNPNAPELVEDELPPLTVSIASPAFVNEGSSFSVVVTLNRPVDAEDGAVVVTVDWGDNSTDTTHSFEVGESSKAISHVYADDNPSGTASDAVTITATMTSPNASSDSTVVIVKNVAPRELELTLSDQGINENGNVTLTVKWQDPGVYDTFTVRIEWGDGSVQNLTSTPGDENKKQVTHRYLDDNPTNTASDQYSVRVRIRDDDTGTAEAKAAVTVNNVDPDADSIAVSPSEVNEGEVREFTFTWDDPGSRDWYMVYIDWDGNGTFEESWWAGSNRSLKVKHMFVDDHPETGTPWDNIEVKVRVVDDDTGEANSDEVVKVNNVAPTLCIVVDPNAEEPVKGNSCLDVSLTIDEGGGVEVRGVFQDPGVLDTHTVTIDWGYDGFTNTTFNFAPDPAYPMLDWHAFNASQIYGDNGIYTITAKVEDDDTGTATATATITVNNVNPTVEIDEAEATELGMPGTILADGSDVKDDGTLDVPTFVTRVDTATQFAAHAMDPGSDDLTFTWDWGDGGTTNVTSLVKPPDADPANSPSVQPRDITTTAVHTWAKACLYNVKVDVLDDDGGTDWDETSVVVTGTERRIFAPGYWYNQYDITKKNRNQLAKETLDCYLRIVNHMSRVFGANPDQFWQVDSFVKMRDALNTKKTSKDTEIMQRQLMAAWLNFANGSIQWFDLVDTNGDRIPDKQFGQLMRESEELRLDPTATRAQLLAQEAILKIVNGD